MSYAIPLFKVEAAILTGIKCVYLGNRQGNTVGDFIIGFLPVSLKGCYCGKENPRFCYGNLKLPIIDRGSSATKTSLAVANTLTEHGKGFYEIFIDTNDLKTIHPFGKDVFQKNLGISNKLHRNLVFIGRNGHEIRT